MSTVRQLVLHPRRGFSLVELLVSIAIVGILLALILPAVQASREASRKVQCLSHVKQIALAVANYESSHGCYPPSGGFDQASIFVRILPDIDQSTLFNQFDFNKRMTEQPALAYQRPELLVCPSDGVATSDPPLRSYGGNVGWFVLVSPLDPRGQAAPNGAFTFLIYPPVGSRDITDGLSNTVMISETLPSGSNPARRICWNERATGPILGRPVEVLASDCLAATSTYLGLRGASWTLGGATATLYDHVLPPNSRNCNWVDPASSVHSGGGVNSAFCDGSARYISQAIDIVVWRAMGTRSNGEVFSYP